MNIIVNRKMSIMLLALMVQLSVHGITELQAKIGTLLAGIAGGCIVSGYEDNRITSGAFLGSSALAYKWLEKYTARAQLSSINLELDKINEQGYGNCWVPKSEEIKPFEMHKHLFSPENLNPAISGNEYENFIILIKTRSYGNAEHSLAVAYEKVKALYPIIEKSAPLLKSMHNDAQADGLSQLLQETNNRCVHYLNDLAKVDLWIKQYPGFADQSAKYQQWKRDNEQLAINQQTADAKKKMADAAAVAAQAKVREAQAKEKEANAAKSYTRLQWLKAIWSWLFGKK
jgi:hypothetical protein